MYRNKYFQASMVAAALWCALTPGLWAAPDNGTPAGDATATNAAANDTPAQQRHEIDAMARTTLDELTATQASAHDLLARASGYAVFQATRAGAIVTGAGGRGVAVDNTSGKHTYMTMASAGVGLGGGIQGYKLVLLFETPQALNTFLDGKWDASASAVAAAGKDGKNAVSSFVDGIAVYQLTDKGLMAQVDISGTRFWPNGKLNEQG
jgi:lipid-binding SYLF domain-containing protein